MDKPPLIPAQFELQAAQVPLLISFPHSGTALPDGLRQRFTPEACALPDTDWYVSRLYDWLEDYGVGCIIANYSRYVVDLNRPPDNRPLYSGKSTGLVPTGTFSEQAIYLPQQMPDEAETSQRIKHYWEPYHQALEAELQRIKAEFGWAVLLDAHSIKSQVPMLFAGVLPELNLGTNNGQSAAPELIQAAFAALQNSRFQRVLDQRFKGGYITRHYGRPKQSIHALQLELAQSSYMQEEPPEYAADKADQIKPVLRGLIEALLTFKGGQ